jgi:hypothetical protein
MSKIDTPSRGNPLAEDPITIEDVHAAQQAWGDGIVAIGEASAEGGDARLLAAAFLDDLYAFELGPVLFKPTKAALVPFRGDRRAALSYFVAGDEAFPEDHGFALHPWRAVRFENTGVIPIPDGALAMGHYVFTTSSDQETRVEYSFAYLRDPEGRLRIRLHHSSLPFVP